jgi:2-polyprenyl-3-methyl-5-hydroxy-6-metoxy-1,4-benzoquinol methylase
MLCNAEDFQIIHNLRDDNTHLAVECSSCGHVQLSPLPTIKEEIEFYQKNEMGRRLISKNQLDDEGLALKYEIWGEEQCKIAVNKISDTKVKILEIGSGYGWFVEKMRKRGYTVDGIELSDEKRQMAEKRSGIKLLSCNLLKDNLPIKMQEAYDMVCCFYVLEHILDPLFFVRQILRALKPEGTLFVIVPNHLDQLKQLSEAYNNFSYFRAHLSYFKPETLRLLLIKEGLDHVEIEGTQLYNLENAIYWLRNGVPFLEYSQIEMPTGLEWIGEYYEQTLEKNLTSDGLIVTGRKKNYKH